MLFLRSRFCIQNFDLLSPVYNYLIVSNMSVNQGISKSQGWFKVTNIEYSLDAIYLVEVRELGSKGLGVFARSNIP